MPDKDKEEDFTIPPKFLKELAEFSNGGYFLLTFSEKGRPVVHFHADTEKDQIALEGSLERYMDKMTQERYKGSNQEENDED